MQEQPHGILILKINSVFGPIMKADFQLCRAVAGFSTEPMVLPAFLILVIGGRQLCAEMRYGTDIWITTIQKYSDFTLTNDTALVFVV